MVLGCTARTWAISPLVVPPTYASGLVAMAGGGDEWLTTGDVTTYHERLNVAGDLWWCIFLKLRHRQHVRYLYRGNGCRGAWSFIVQSAWVKLSIYKYNDENFFDYRFFTFLTGSRFWNRLSVNRLLFNITDHSRQKNILCISHIRQLDARIKHETAQWMLTVLKVDKKSVFSDFWHWLKSLLF